MNLEGFTFQQGNTIWRVIAPDTMCDDDESDRYWWCEPIDPKPAEDAWADSCCSFPEENLIDKRMEKVRNHEPHRWRHH